MIHRAPFGSMERFIAVLIENCAGNFPLWLAPTQVAVLPISDKFSEYANFIAKRLDIFEVRNTIDHRNEKIGRKIRDAEMQKTPYMLVIGEKEENEMSIAVRRHGEGDRGVLDFESFIKMFDEELNS